MPSFKYAVGKRRGIFIAFSDNCDCSLKLHQNPTSGNFLKVVAMWNIKPYQVTFPWTFLCTALYWNPQVHHSLWREFSSPTQGFITSYSGHLENTGSLDYVQIFHTWKFFKYVMATKSHLFIHCRSQSSEWSLMCWEAVTSTVAKARFPAFWFHLDSLSGITGNKYYPLIFLRRQAPFLDFWGNSYQISNPG